MSDIPLVQQISLQSSYGAPEEVFSAWRESLSPFFDSVALFDVDEQPPVALDAVQYQLGSFLFYDSTFSRQKFVRDSRWMAQHDDADHVLLQTWLTGTNKVSNGGVEYTERAGNVFAVNLGYDVDATCEDAEVLSLVLSRDWLNLHLPQLATLRGSVFQEDGSMAVRVFNDYMLSLQKNLPTMKESEVAMMQDNIPAMLESLIVYSDIESGDVKNSSVSVICSYIDKNLRNSALSIDHLCRHFRCSRATLYRLFKPHGGVRGYIQKRRLMGCFKMLTSPVHLNKQVFEIARLFGFSNPSHFSTLFKQHFDMSPKDVRDAGVVNHSAKLEASLAWDRDKLNPAQAMRHWAETLSAQAANKG